MTHRFIGISSHRMWIVVLFLAGGAMAVSADTAGPGKGWPEFRGPWGNGHASAPGVPAGLPLEWSETRNITWKRAIPHRGLSSPVVLNGQVWLTTATEDGGSFYAVCLDAETGETRYYEQVFQAEDPEPLGNDVNSYASPTPVLAPGRAYIHFGSYGTVCLDTSSFEPVWERTDLECRHFRGPGSSPILVENLLILTFDGADVQYVAALDKDTGETVWKSERSTDWPDLDENGQPRLDGDFRKAFTTPLAIDVDDRRLLVSPASFAAFAYDVRTGEEVWTTTNDSYSPAPRPVYGDGLLFLTTGRGPSELWALRPDGTGDVTNTHVLWRERGRAVPEEPSPLLVDGLLYLVSNQGIVTCFEAATGEVVWTERLAGNYLASPIYADGRLYFFNTRGRTTVLKAGRETEVLAENELDAGFKASPAVYGNALFLRTMTHLYRIEE